jgi:flavin reductase (DIM6/NTAB) family NADH-FMN oxidoreductase RutF
MTSHPAGPPTHLTRPLDLTPHTWPNQDVYHLLTGLVVPRPIAWVSTLGVDGVRNVAPHSYFALVSHDPPHVVFSATAVRDTLTNVRARGEFVINIVTVDLVEQMNLTATDFPPGEDEFRWAGLTAEPAAAVTAPRVAQAKAHLECRVVTEVAVGTAALIIGEVVHIHVDQGVWRDGRVDPALLDPVCRLAGTGYATLGEIFKLQRPRWDHVREADARRNLR